MKRILLIVGGGIAAYKACELVRLCRKAGIEVTCVLTEGGQHFVTAMTLAALSENQVYTTLWDLKDEAEMGHIQLSRQADLIVVAPATADLLARMAAGAANDLATTLLLATDKPVLAAPAMNVRMWQHLATQRNVAQLRADGVTVLEPDEGPMACGEYGPGRLPEPEAILAAIQRALAPAGPSLVGKHVLVTAGPTHEPIDPVRYIANRSSGRQGYAIAEALARLGARVTLVSGPVALPTPAGVTRIDVETAREMADAVDAALPADAAVMVAAVGDWRARRLRDRRSRKAIRPLRCACRKTRTFWRASPPDLIGPGWWWASPPKPRRSSSTPPQKGIARAQTGLSRTTFRGMLWGAGATPSTLSLPRASRAGNGCPRMKWQPG
jgi:phosphopantothenoylcysteine decarboxylase/phosphopantothenate--cysteine ligase